MSDLARHRPVLLNEAVEGLNVRQDGLYVDGTYGRGGHAAAVAERLGAEGRLWVVDRDPEAIAAAQRQFDADPRVTVIRGSSADLDVLAPEAPAGRVDGLLLDLGVSSPQLDDARRGFSFSHDGPLDMRMDPDSGPSAREWLESTDEPEIARVLKVYGEERFARRIARAVVAAREAGHMPTTTAELVELVRAAVPFEDRHKHPATRTFQALRIAVNRELDELARLLERVSDWLAPGGRLVVISFHSLEDRMVKRFIRRESGVRDLPPEIPVVPEALRPRLKAVGKPRRGATTAEAADNPRARSAVLRVAERLP